jgi:hypothetical protein
MRNKPYRQVRQKPTLVASIIFAEFSIKVQFKLSRRGAMFVRLESAKQGKQHQGGVGHGVEPKRRLAALEEKQDAGGVGGKRNQDEGALIRPRRAPIQPAINPPRIIAARPRRIATMIKSCPE